MLVSKTHPVFTNIYTHSNDPYCSIIAYSYFRQFVLQFFSTSLVGFGSNDKYEVRSTQVLGYIIYKGLCRSMARTYMQFLTQSKTYSSFHPAPTSCSTFYNTVQVLRCLIHIVVSVWAVVDGVVELKSKYKGACATRLGK